MAAVPPVTFALSIVGASWQPAGPPMVTAGFGATTRLAAALAVQPLESVTSTVYIPVVATVMLMGLDVKPPGPLHFTVNGAVALVMLAGEVWVEPGQMGAGGGG